MLQCYVVLPYSNTVYDGAHCISEIESLMSEEERSNTPIMITVCGATCESLGQQNRVRAIPKAAGIRFFIDSHIDSDTDF